MKFPASVRTDVKMEKAEKEEIKDKTKEETSDEASDDDKDLREDADIRDVRYRLETLSGKHPNNNM